MKPFDLIAAQQRRAIATCFIAAAALSRETAIPFAPPTTPVGRRTLRRMVAFGAVRRTRRGTYWLDEPRLADFREEALARVLGWRRLPGWRRRGRSLLGDRG